VVSLTGLFANHALRYIELALVVLIAWVVSSWWQTGSSNQPSLDAVQIKQKQQRPLDIKLLESTALFGAEQQVKMVRHKPERVVASRLNLKLLATVVSEKRAAAVVSINGSANQQVFFVGDEMLPGVRLETVEIAAIVVKNHGQFERVLLPKSQSIKGIEVHQAQYRKKRTLKRFELDRQIKNLPKLLSEAKVVPYFRGGKVDGFVIGDIVVGSLYEKLGLKNGDVIHKVNGEVLTSVAQGIALYQRLQHAGAIDLELERHGVILPIHYDIR